jgi:hypothetical protein
MNKKIIAQTKPDFSGQPFNLFFRPAGIDVATPHGTFAKYHNTRAVYVIEKNGTPTYSPGTHAEFDTLEAALAVFEQMNEEIDRHGHALGVLQ